VWGYALLWFLVNDRVKLLAYRIFDPVQNELYEQLGREEVRAVEDLEKTEREVQEHAAHK
jgi:hypothetical protein